MKIIFSQRCMEYFSPGNPDTPQRITYTYDYLKKERMEFVEPKPAAESDILLVHSKELLAKVKSGDFFDPDTPSLENIYYYAALSAGGAIKAMEYALKKESAFSLMRPPGHHAGKDSLGGFCYFNNLAIAVKKASSTVKKIAILDIDCHHGNGTEEIFLGQSEILFISLHREFLYPGSGLKSHKNCLNYPLNAETDESAYMATLKTALARIREFKPGLLAVSAGFDTYKSDPVAGMGLEIGSFQKIGSEIASLNIPYFCVLEGGYSGELSSCIYAFLTGCVFPIFGGHK